MARSFLEQYSRNEDDIMLNFLISNLIHNGASFKALIIPSELIQEKEYMQTKITNIFMDFISRNPKSAKALKQNDKVHDFLSSIDLDFYPKK